MTEECKSPAPEPSRADRLSAALRANLKRRKAQARAQQDIKMGADKKADKDKAPSR